jgi:hypothetical protein
VRALPLFLKVTCPLLRRVERSQVEGDGGYGSVLLLFLIFSRYPDLRRWPR